MLPWLLKGNGKRQFMAFSHLVLKQNNQFHLMFYEIKKSEKLYRVIRIPHFVRFILEMYKMKRTNT